MIDDDGDGDDHDDDDDCGDHSFPSLIRSFTQSFVHYLFIFIWPTTQQRSGSGD